MAAGDTGPNDTGGGEHAGGAPYDDAFEQRQRRASRIGVVLVVVGAVALLSNLGAFQGIGNVVGTAIFTVLGAWALSHYLNRRRIGSLIGAFVLFGLAAATVGGVSAGFYFLGLIGVGFAAVYYVDRERWWAVILAGTMLSLAVVAGLSEWAPGYNATWVLFVGLALTFGVLYVLPGESRPWAIYPAVVCLALAVLGLTFIGNWLVPIALVVVGVALLLRQNAERGRWDGAAGPTGPGGGAGGDSVAARDQAGGPVAPSGAPGAAPGTAGAGSAEAPGAPADGPAGAPEGESGTADDPKRQED